MCTSPSFCQSVLFAKILKGHCRGKWFGKKHYIETRVKNLRLSRGYYPFERHRHTRAEAGGPPQGNVCSLPRLHTFPSQCEPPSRSSHLTISDAMSFYRSKITSALATQNTYLKKTPSGPPRSWVAQKTLSLTGVPRGSKHISNGQFKICTLVFLRERRTCLAGKSTTVGCVELLGSVQRMKV
jgi:hypothetical protein